MAEPAPTACYDPYVLSSDGVREPPTTLRQALRKTGPGMILAASIVGTGELIATTHAGAKAGFAILWLVVISCFIKVFVQIELGRFAISSGETTLTSFARLPGPGRLLTWWWFFMMLTTQAQISAMIGGVGYTIYMVIPEATEGLDRPALPWAAAVALGTALLLVRGTYQRIERSMVVLVVLFTVLTVACVLLLPFNERFAFGWGDLAGGLTFHVPTDRAVILAAVAMIGITGVGASELIAYPYWCIEKGYARNVGPNDSSEAWRRRARGWLRVMELDAWVSLAVYTVATLAFFILGAAVLNAGGAEGLPDEMDGLLRSLADMYAPVLGPRTAKIFIVLGAFAVLYSTLVASTAANSRSGTDFLRVNGLIAPRGPGERFRWVQRFSVGFMVLGFTLFAFFPNPVHMVMIGGFAQALTLPMIAAAALYLRYRRTDRRLTPGLVWSALLWLSLLAFVAAAVYGVWSQLRKLG
jgi:manganese transport protein